MKTISQVAELTGVSTRTLQYYDEIDLLKPSRLTPSGYRLYGEEALGKLQQILFFKELDFKLKEIREILQTPQFNQADAFREQKKLLILKRDRMNRLIGLLERLEKGEQCMSFEEFDLSEYIEALESFKDSHTEDVIRHWGSVENFDRFIRKVRDDEPNLARLAVKQFGSVEKYTEAMKHNLEHFSEIMEQYQTVADGKEEILSKNQELFERLTSDLSKDVTSEEIQEIVRELTAFTQETMPGVELGEGYWDFVIESCTGQAGREINDAKYGVGASDYIARALRYYFHGE